jgi:hypothetical protein
VAYSVSMGFRHAVSNLSAPSVIAGLVLGLACAGGGAIAAGQITGAQIKDKTITQRDVASQTLKSRNLRNNSVKGKDIKDGSLTNQDIEVYYAVLTDEGVLVRNSGNISALRLPLGEGVGRYQVDFNVDVTTCAYVATVGSVVGGTTEGQAGTGLLTGTNDTVRVNTTNSQGDATNRSFHLAVIC